MEITDGGPALSWEGTPETSAYRIYRFERTSGERDLERAEQVVGTTEEMFFVDTHADEELQYIYYLRAEDGQGSLSGKSNFVGTPPLGILVTFDILFSTIERLAGTGMFSSPGAKRYVSDSFREAHAAMTSGHAEEAKDLLQGLRETVGENEWKGGSLLDPLAAEDLEILLSKLAKRIHLVEVSVLIPTHVL